MALTVTSSTNGKIEIDLSEATRWEKRIVVAQIELMQSQIQAIYDLQKEATQ